ncbi:MAG TPA: tannase/feruloyl esterase family alpha/beta hydrolase [Bryobacteraceae bacterium]|nr:tannase/feruloyl esterase family alpha/beta hydrolase [Bryobacteraceae bacterium]
MAHAQNGCDALKDLKLDHAGVTSGNWMEAGPVPVPMGFPPELQNISVARRCEVDAVSRPTSDSEIHFSLWLPAREDWNGKYLQRGNGGWAGAISISQRRQCHHRPPLLLPQRQICRLLGAAGGLTTATFMSRTQQHPSLPSDPRP